MGVLRDRSTSPQHRDLRITRETLSIWCEATTQREAAASPSVIFEPGRAITSSSQCLVLRVLAVKDGASGVHSVILDGGRNIVMPTGYELHELLAVTGAADPRKIALQLLRTPVPSRRSALSIKDIPDS